MPLAHREQIYITKLSEADSTALLRAVLTNRVGLTDRDKEMIKLGFTLAGDKGWYHVTLEEFFNEQTDYRKNWPDDLPSLTLFSTGPLSDIDDN